MVVVQAVRAVFVELLGVLLVLWLLFGTATWTLNCSGIVRDSDAAAGLFAGLKRTLADQAADFRQSQDAETKHDVAQRLEHYSRIYRRAAAGYVKEIGQSLRADATAQQADPRAIDGLSL